MQFWWKHCPCPLENDLPPLSRAHSHPLILQLKLFCEFTLTVQKPSHHLWKREAFRDAGFNSLCHWFFCVILGRHDSFDKMGTRNSTVSRGSDDSSQPVLTLQKRQNQEATGLEVRPVDLLPAWKSVIQTEWYWQVKCALICLFVWVV